MILYVPLLTSMLQVSALRSAISYIKSLQSLVADCDAGKLGDEVYTDSRRLDSVTSLGETEVRGQGRGVTKKRPASRQRQRPVQRARVNRNTQASAGGAGVNEISLHISLLDPSTSPAPVTVAPQTQVLYILQLDDKNIQHLQ